jgi:hypothetical protein
MELLGGTEPMPAADRQVALIREAPDVRVDGLVVRAFERRRRFATAWSTIVRQARIDAALSSQVGPMSTTLLTAWRRREK